MRYWKRDKKKTQQSFINIFNLTLKLEVYLKKKKNLIFKFKSSNNTFNNSFYKIIKEKINVILFAKRKKKICAINYT